MTPKVFIQNKDCSCNDGNSLPWMEIEGQISKSGYSMIKYIIFHQRAVNNDLGPPVIHSEVMYVCGSVY